MRDNVLILFLQYTEQHQESGLRTLLALSSRLFPKCKQSVLVVDNARSSRAEEQLGPEFDRISGDNRWREFSGYDRGIRWFESLGPITPHTPVIIANDTFHRSYGDEYLRLFSEQSAERAVTSGSVLGYVDAFPEPVSLFDYTIQKWVRTSLVVLSYGALKKLLPFTPGVEPDSLFLPGAEPTFFREDAPLSANYRQFLRSWLFAPKPESSVFSEEWHSKAALTEENAQAMKEKAGCILAEHLFSARIQKLQMRTIAVNQEQLDKAGVGNWGNPS